MASTKEILDDLHRIATRAGEKRASSSPGVGQTTFPQDAVDDSTVDAPEGSRFSENTSDAKDVTPGTPADSAGPISGTQESAHSQIGVRQSSTGEDPSIEDDYASSVHDPGTASPARADDGEKYAAMSRGDLAARLDKMAAELCAEAVVEARGGAAAPAAPAGMTPKEAAAAGYADAAAAGGAGLRFVEDTVKEAFYAAELTARHLPEILAKVAAHDPEAAAALGAPPPGEEPADAGPEGGEAAGDDLEAVLGAEPEPAPPADAPPSEAEALDGLNGAADDLQLTPELLEQLLQMLASQGAPHAQKAAKVQGYMKRAYARRFAGEYQAGGPKTARESNIRKKMRTYLAEALGPVRAS